MTTRYGRLLAAALALLALLFACAPAQDTPAPPSTTSSAPAGDAGSEEGEEQQPVPILGEFTATGLDGEEVDQSIFTGYDVTMVNVWATFCGPCLSEMPDLGALHQEFSDQKFQVVGIVTDVVDWNGEVLSSQIDLARQIVEETGASYLHLLPSEDLQSLLLWQVNSVPTTIFVDENGSLVGSGYLGRRDAGAWRAIIQEKLAAVQGEETP